MNGFFLALAIQFLWALVIIELTEWRVRDIGQRDLQVAQARITELEAENAQLDYELGCVQEDLERVETAVADGALDEARRALAKITDLICNGIDEAAHTDDRWAELQGAAA